MILLAACLPLPADTTADLRADVPCNNRQLREACTPGGQPGVRSQTTPPLPSSGPPPPSSYKTKGALRYRLSSSQRPRRTGGQSGGLLLIQLGSLRQTEARLRPASVCLYTDYTTGVVLYRVDVRVCVCVGLGQRASA